MNEPSLTGSATEFEAYCRTKAVPPGSVLHYSLLGQPLAQRRKLLGLYALERELRGIVDDSRDPEVAQSKLVWWRQELRSLGRNQARHPVTQALSSWLRPQDNPPLERMLGSWLDAIEHDLHYGTYSSFPQLGEYCRPIGESYVTLLVQSAGGQAGQNALFIHNLGIGWVLFERLLAVRQNALHGRQYIPEDELARFQLTFSDLQKKQHTPGLQDLFAMQAQRIRGYFKAAEQQLPLAERYRQRHLLILLRLFSAQLSEIEADGYRLLEQHLSLPPLRLLWIAFRVLQRERRYRNLQDSE